jgi:hypothetical protein
MARKKNPNRFAQAGEAFDRVRKRLDRCRKSGRPTDEGSVTFLWTRACHSSGVFGHGQPELRVAYETLADLGQALTEARAANPGVIETELRAVARAMCLAYAALGNVRSQNPSRS